MSAFFTALLTTGLMIAVFAIPTGAYLLVNYLLLTIENSRAKRI